MAQITFIRDPVTRISCFVSGKGKEINARLPRCDQLFPQLIKLLTLSRRPKLIRIGTRLHRANIIQVVVLSGRTSTGQRELWAFRSTGSLAPWSRGVLPMPDPHKRHCQAPFGSLGRPCYGFKRYLMSRPPQ